jgi:hypothetical protein
MSLDIATCILFFIDPDARPGCDYHGIMEVDRKARLANQQRLGAQPATRAASGYRSSFGRQQGTAGLRHPWPGTPALARLPDISALGLGPNCIVIVNTGETPRRKSAQPAKRPKRHNQSIKTRKPRNKKS